MSQDEISGANPMIMAPVQTANPENYGGSELHIGLGFNHDLSLLTSKKDTIGVEFLFPIFQDKNNEKMETQEKLGEPKQKAKTKLAGAGLLLFSAALYLLAV